MKQGFLIFVFYLLCFSCKTVKTTTTEHLNVVAQNDISEKTTTKTETSEKDAFSMSVDQTITIIEKMINTKYSRPDSSGMQHVLETTEIEKNTTIDNLKKEDKQVEKNTEQEVEEEKTDNSSVDINKDAKVKTTKKSKTPVWVIIVCVIVSTGIIALLYFVLKRFKLVK